MAPQQRITGDVQLGLRKWFLVWQNIVGVVLSVPVLVTGILIAREIRGHGEDCVTFMNSPIIAIGALLLLVSLSGFAAAILDKMTKDPILTFLHLLIMFSLVILLFCFAIFCLEITNKGLAHSVTGYGQHYQEYRLYEYPKWMRHRVEDPTYWNKVKGCLQDSSVCESGDLPTSFSNITHESLENLTPIQKGCCIPPAACNITYLGISDTTMANVKEEYLPSQHDVETTTTKGNKIKIEAQQRSPSTINITSKEKSFNNTDVSKAALEAISTTLHLYTHDCKRWSNLPEQLCFDCDTCKAGTLQDSMDRWTDSAKIFVVLVVVMIISYALFLCYGFKESTN